ncbi:hypothetical protein GCM10010372_35700 [Streptomyces tauricus]|nr:hypothetical protein GCM10010372_35700 [Streptomyces tauricus]
MRERPPSAPHRSRSPPPSPSRAVTVTVTVSVPVTELQPAGSNPIARYAASTLGRAISLAFSAPSRNTPST